MRKILVSFGLFLSFVLPVLAACAYGAPPELTAGDDDDDDDVTAVPDGGSPVTSPDAGDEPPPPTGVAPLVLTEICLALPEAERTYTGQHARFLVRGKTFAYYLVDHHGDGIVGITCKAPPGAAEAMIASDPTRFYRPDYLGPRGWVGLRLDHEPVDWTEAAELLADSYRLIAPKRLSSLLHHLP